MKANLSQLMSGAAVGALLATCYGTGVAHAQEAAVATAQDTPATAQAPADDQATTDASKQDDTTQASSAATTVESASEDDGSEIIVRGLRASLDKSREAKRRAQQIVDVITADDIGKLPDKNVPDALSRIPGVILDRSRGEGSDFSIRGMYGVMTTVDGTPTFSGGDRTTNLSDMPSDLVAGIQVYKTRTPDQVEGSASGVVNLTLRKPTDFKQGLTVALNVRGDYSDQVRKVNPFVSTVIGYNRETGIGKIGFVLSGSHNYVRYNESLRTNSTPVQLRSPEQIVDPTTTPANLYVPYSVSFTARSGYNQRDALNGSFQWKPDDRWSFTTDFAGSRAERPNFDDDFTFPIRDTFGSDPAPRLTNLVIGGDGRQIDSLTVETHQPIGPGKNKADALWNSRSAKQTIDYQDEKVHFTASYNYARSWYAEDQLWHKIQFANNPVYDVVFNTSTDPRGGVAVSLRGVDLSDPNNYSYITDVYQSTRRDDSTEREQKFDLQVNTFWSFLDYIKVGMRRAKRTYLRDRGSRSAWGLQIPISSLSGYKLTPVDTALQGTASASTFSWMIGDASSIEASWDQLRPLIATSFTDFAEGDRPKLNQQDHVTGFEVNYSAYAMTHYNLKLFIPIEGIVGTRLVNLKSGLTSYSFSTLPDGTDVTTPVRTRANSLDVLPSFNAIGHFTDKLQLRLSWTKDVQRPSVDTLNPVLWLDSPNSTNPTGWGGNAALKPMTLKKLDLSLEWYFGKTGTVSIALFDWRQQGTIFRDSRYEVVPGYTVPVYVSRPRNAGKSRYKGLEVQGTTFLPFLPWLFKYVGVNGNFTLYDSKVQYPEYDEATKTTVFYETQEFWRSKYAFNAAIFYEHAGLNARLAYNWRSKRVDSFDSKNPYRNLFTDPTQRLDASINYDINSRFALGLEATNITKKGDRNYWGYYSFPQDITYFARTFALTARARF
jgi:iron complex outermembrane recepter protein